MGWVEDFLAKLNCRPQEIVETAPASDLTTGLSMSTSEGCAECALSIGENNTVSSVDVQVVVHQSSENVFPINNPGSLGELTASIRITPIIPLQVTFNGMKYTVSTLYWGYPAPLRVEGQQADAFLVAVGDGLTLVFPLASTVNASSSSETSSDFFSNITPLLGDLKDKDGNLSAKKIAGIPVGQNWSLGKLAKDKDPYFTWVNAEYERYVKYEIPCKERRIGWRAKDGPRVIYMKKPATIAEGDLGILRSIVGRFDPSKMFKTLPHVFYYPPNEPCDPGSACASKPKKALGQSSSKDLSTPLQIIIGFAVVFLFCVAVIFGVVYSEQPGNLFEKAGGVIANLPSAGFLTVLFGGLVVFALAAAGVAGAFN